MVYCKERRHPRTEVIAARAIAGIPKFRHEPVPAMRDVPVVDADFEWARRKSIPWQRGHDHVELLKHRQHFQIVEETAGPAMREDERHTRAGCGTLVHEVDALPSELLERVELALPSTPVKLIGPVGHEAPQPVQLSALTPANARYLTRPSCIAQPCPQIVEHLVGNMNPKWLHYHKSLQTWPAERPGVRSEYHSQKTPRQPKTHVRDGGAWGPRQLPRRWLRSVRSLAGGTALQF